MSNLAIGELLMFKRPKEARSYLVRSGLVCPCSSPGLCVVLTLPNPAGGGGQPRHNGPLRNRRSPGQQFGMGTLYEGHEGGLLRCVPRRAGRVFRVAVRTAAELMCGPPVVDITNILIGRSPLDSGPLFHEHVQGRHHGGHIPVYSGGKVG